MEINLNIELSSFSELSRGCVNALRKAKIITLKDLLSHSKKDLSYVCGFGEKSMIQVEALLSKYGYSLKSNY